MTEQQVTNHKKVQKLAGLVVSTPDSKTVVVAVDAFIKHPKYHKRYRFKKKYLAHLDNFSCKVGDKVEIIPSRPYSRSKRFLVIAKA